VQQAGAGFALSGSGPDIISDDSATQRALVKEVIGQRGQTTEAGYEAGYQEPSPTASWRVRLDIQRPVKNK
jgi:hypothetical protein